MTIILGLIAIVVGVLIVIYTEWIIKNFGVNDWAEAHFAGGSRFLYKVIGVGLVFVSLIVMTGLGGEILVGTFGQLFGL